MKQTVLVIGGGPAGLTAALRLSRLGHKVTLLEERKELGGRVLVDEPPVSASFPDSAPASSPLMRETFPLVLLGCHTATWTLLESLGTLASARQTERATYEFLLPNERVVRMRRPRLLSPFHTIGSIATFRALPWRDRWRLLSFLERTWERDPALPADLEHRTAREWLTDIGQSDHAQNVVWSPLAGFLLGHPLKQVSASLFISICTRGFLSRPRHSDITVPIQGFRELFLLPAQEQLVRMGAAIQLGSVVTQLRFNGERVTEVQLQDGRTQQAEWYVLAVPHHRLSPLLPERIVTRFAYFQHCAQLSDSPTVTVHLRLTSGPPGPRLVLLAEKPFDWFVTRPDVSHRTSEGSQSLASFVATGRRDVFERPDEQLREAALRNLTAACPSARTSQLLDHRIVRASHGWLAATPGIQRLRPLQQSPCPNLLVAGGWTDTGWPANLESAILGGERCVEAITATREQR
ncbi:MAG: hydroxysqualene dehydroxylase HpnE [Nitrospiraceae bacterium]